MKFRFLTFLLIIMMSCHSNEAELKALKMENQALMEKLEAYDDKQKEVVLKNTTTRSIISQYNGQQYQIKVSFPKNYVADSARYPVLYVLDAETNFGGTSYIVQRLIKDRLIPEIIVVGIAYDTDYKNFYSLRSRDLTPVEDKELRMGNHAVDPTGGAAEFSNFLFEELFPFISKELNIENNDRAIYGHSYGGLFGCYTFLEKPELFNRYIILSPSLWFKDEYLIDRIKKQTLDIKSPTRLYMASGTEEGRIDDMQIEFSDLIKSKKPERLELQSEILDDETHRTIFGRGFTNGLRYIYQK